MPELTAPRYAPRAATSPAASSDSSRVRWRRVAAVSLVLFASFYLFEHDPAAFAGLKIGDTSEDRIADKYIDDIEEGSRTRKIIVPGFAAIGLLLAATSTDRRWNPRWQALAPLVGLMLWAGLSAAWSDEPSLTVRRLAVLSLFLVGAVGFARGLRPNELLVVTITTLAAFIALSLLLDLRAGGRPWERDYRFGGTLHPNIQAAYCSTLCLAAFCSPARWGGRSLRRALLVFGLAMLVLTQSRTNVIALLIGLLAAFMIRLRPSTRWWAGATLVSLVALAAITFGSLSDSGRRQLVEVALLGRTEQTKSLTGRAPLWDELTRYLADRPITGFGYETFWTGDRVAAVMKTQDWAIQSAHNAYFELALQLGLVGLALGLAFALGAMTLSQAAYTRVPLASYAFVYGLIAFALANSLLESHFVKVKYPSVLALIGVLNVIVFFPDRVSDEPPRDAPTDDAPQHV